MGKAIRKLGKFYSSIIMHNIGILIFIGLMQVIFSQDGWFPNTNIHAISKLSYDFVLPICISYMGGMKTGKNIGGTLSIVAVTGILVANVQVGVFAAMTIGPLVGILWREIEKIQKKYSHSSMEMLIKNLMIGILGICLSLIGYYLGTPFFEKITNCISFLMNGLIKHHFLALLSLIVEPMKILFLNNIVNHGILVPLAIEEVGKTGSSILFLIESNPGPGLGMLLALFSVFKTKRSEYASAIIAQAIGGIHEIYFPFVLSNGWLLLPLIAGGMTGTLWFDYMNAGIKGIISPGSIFTILLLAGKGNTAILALGIFFSSSVSFIGCRIILKLQSKKKTAKRKNKREKQKSSPNLKIEENFKKPVLHQKKKDEKIQESKTEVRDESVNEKNKISRQIHKIGFVCDAGMGSSAMGAAIFRRKLAQEKIEQIEVNPFAVDQIPTNLDLIVCQKDFYPLLPENIKEKEIFLVDNFVSAQAYDELIKLF